MREVEAVDGDRGRNSVRIVHSDAGYVFIETWGNHDGTSVHTSVRVDRAMFRNMVQRLGVM